MSQSIGERLRHTLNDADMSMRKLHRVAHIPYRSIQNYAMDKQKPGAEALLKMREALGVNIDWLLAGEGEQFVNKSRVRPRRATLRDMVDLEHKFTDLEQLAEAILASRRIGRSIVPPLGQPAFKHLQRIQSAAHNIRHFRLMFDELSALESAGKLPDVDLDELTIPEMYDLYQEQFGRAPGEDIDSKPEDGQK